MKSILPVFLLSIIFHWSVAQRTITTPEEFLGYELGDAFTQHYKVVNYFKLLEEESDGRMKIIQYGETNEGRPLMVAVLSSEENMSRLEEIRTNNLKRTGLLPGDAENLDVAIVWLSYNVHGNEAVSTEASLKTIHKLLNPNDTDSKAWLDKTVVIMDPCINPDGRDRYVQFYTQFGQNPPNADPTAFSHLEQWPYGRTNHYYHDLNRDWAWQTQKESRERLVLYQQWMPHIHVDFHEQGYNSPYYFAPGAEPYHSVITDWQRNFQVEIGKNHATYFDKNFWVYFTRENFDLLYPSYGDTYPTYNGAIGMTYEQGGGGRGALAVINEYGDTLTLKDRIEHHYTTGFSTVEVAADNSERIENEFSDYFNNPVNGPYKSYLISGSNDPVKVKKLTELLDKHLIRYGYTSSNKRTSGYNFQTGTTGDVTPGSSDLVIPVNQPKGRLITALFEPETYLSDTLTYDITAWSLPYAYGLAATALPATLAVDEKQPIMDKETVEISGDDYAYLLPYKNFEDGKALAMLLKKGIRTSVANKGFEINGKTFDPGTIVILKANNLKEDLASALNDIQDASNTAFIPVSTGFVTRGIDLGSNYVSRIAPPRIAVLAGEGTSANNVGELWYFFEKEIKYPMTMLDAKTINRIDLTEFDLIIVPETGYGSNGSQMGALADWVKSGGRVLAIGSGVNLFANGEEMDIQTYSNGNGDGDKDEELSNYGMEERIRASSSIPGAIFPVSMDPTFPLAYGYDKTYYSLKTSSMGPVKLKSGIVYGKLDEGVKPVNGYAGAKALDNISGNVVFGVDRFGSGEVIFFVDNPLFRSFWENGKLLVVNALFMN